MAEDLTKKAVNMLLKGATLLSEPCPYCKGVRIMKDGNALCVSCGKEPEAESKPIPVHEKTKPNVPLSILEKRLEKLSHELEVEYDHEKQQQMRSMHGRCFYTNAVPDDDEAD